MTETLTQEQVQRTHDRRRRPVGPHYKWVALTNTTLGSLMATIDASIVLIAFPAIFKELELTHWPQANQVISSGSCLAIWS